MTPKSFGQRLFGVFGLELVTGVVRLGVPVLMARAIGAVEYGEYAACTNLTLLVFNLAASGLPLAATYYAATQPSRQTTRQLLTCVSLVSAAAVGVCIPLALLYQTAAIEGLSASILVLSIAAALPYSVELTALGVLRGQGRLEHASLFGLLRQVVLAMVAAAIGWLGGSAEHALAAFAICTLALSGLVSVIALLAGGSMSTAAPPTFRAIGRYSAHVQTSTLLTFLNYRLTLFLVAALASGEAVGIFAGSLAVAEGVWLFSHVVSSVLAGEVASGRQSRELTARASRLVTAASVAAAVVVACASRVIMRLYGPEFVSGWDTLLVLAFAASVLAPSRVLATHHAAMGSPGSNIRGTVMGLGVNLVLTAVLVPYLGLVGAGVSTLVAYAVVAADRILLFIHAAPQGERVRVRDLLVPRSDDFRALLRALPIKSSILSAVADEKR